jgi:hypothetical protein
LQQQRETEQVARDVDRGVVGRNAGQLWIGLHRERGGEPAQSLVGVVGGRVRHGTQRATGRGIRRERAEQRLLGRQQLLRQQQSDPTPVARAAHEGTVCLPQQPAGRHRAQPHRGAEMLEAHDGRPLVQRAPVLGIELVPSRERCGERGTRLGPRQEGLHDARGHFGARERRDAPRFGRHRLVEVAAVAVLIGWRAGLEREPPHELRPGQVRPHAIGRCGRAQVVERDGLDRLPESRVRQRERRSQRRWLHRAGYEQQLGRELIAVAPAVLRLDARLRCGHNAPDPRIAAAAAADDEEGEPPDDRYWRTGHWGRRE